MKMFIDFLLISGGVFLSIFSIVYIIKTIIYEKRRKKSKNWKIGDAVKLTFSSPVDYSDKFHELISWNKHNIFVQYKSTIYKCSWSHLKINKSAEWREDYNKCKKFMTQEPNYSKFEVFLENGEVLVKNNKKDNLFDKPIELLNETESEIALKNAIEKEDFELAELIRQHMDNKFS